MKKDYFNKLSRIVDSYIYKTKTSFSVYVATFQKEALEIKTRSYGGYELSRLVGNFNQKSNQLCDELLDEISSLFNDIGRKLSDKQYENLKEKCVKLFEDSSNTFAEAFNKEFGLNGSLELSFLNTKRNIISRINNYINILNIKASTRINKALIWTIWGTIFAGLSTILSVIAIIISLYK